MGSKCLKDIKIEFTNKIGKARYLKEVIRKLIEQNDHDLVKEKIKDYKNLFPNDVEITSMEVVLLIAEGKIEIAEKYAVKGLAKVPFYFDLNYNLGYIYQMRGKYQDAANAFIKASNVVTTEEQKNATIDAINQIKEIDKTVDISKLNEIHHKVFPLKTINDTWIGKQLFQEENGGYIPLYYNENAEGFPSQLWNLYKTETLKGEIYNSENVEVELEGDTALPLAVLDKRAPVNIKIGVKNFEFTNLIPNRYYYFPIEQKGRLQIKSNSTFVMAEPIPLQQNKKHDVKLVLNLFVDGLSQKMLIENSLKKLMPNTYSFFKKGTIFNNCYSNADWTLASVPSIFTGKHLANHKIFHPELPHVIGELHETVSGYFKKEDYMTFQRCGNWRKTPSYGYVKGFDRTIYQSAIMGSRVEEVVGDFLEHMRAFPNRDHFIWLSFFELHNVDDDLDLNISNQIINSMGARHSKTDNMKSVDREYDKNKKGRYINEIKRIDFYLKIIYDFVVKNYHNDEILVSLCSDHGQSYLDHEVNIHKESRTKVPFMIRGKDIPSNVSEELIENVDILPIMLSKCSIKYDPSLLDGEVPCVLNGVGTKKFVLWESIYPGKTYKAVLKDLNHSLIFETVADVEKDGRFLLDEFSVCLKNNLTGQDESFTNPGKTVNLFEWLISHISDFIKI